MGGGDLWRSRGRPQGRVPHQHRFLFLWSSLRPPLQAEGLQKGSTFQTFRVGVIDLGLDHALGGQQFQQRSAIIVFL